MKWTDDRVARLREMHREGLRHREIAEAFGVSTRAVSNKCLRLGLYGNAADWPSSRVAKLRALRRRQLSFGQIAKELGISRSAVAGRVFRERQPHPRPAP